MGRNSVSFSDKTARSSFTFSRPAAYSSFASFLVSKGFDQFRMSVAFSELNVKVIGSHGGITVGEDGASQMSIEDVALMTSLPGFVVMVPADEISTRALVFETSKYCAGITPFVWSTKAADLSATIVCLKLKVSTFGKIVMVAFGNLKNKYPPTISKTTKTPTETGNQKDFSSFL